MKAEIRMIPHIVCPNCGNGDGFTCQHILTGEWGNSFGPWYCDDCGHSITGKRVSDGSIDIEIGAERSLKTVDLLVLKPQEKPVYFIVEGSRYVGGRVFGKERDADEEHDSKQFLYEEHSCPTNWLKPVMVYHDGDSDPHGLIEFVATRDDATFPPDENYGSNDRDAAFIEFIEKANENATSPRAGNRLETEG